MVVAAICTNRLAHFIMRTSFADVGAVRLDEIGYHIKRIQSAKKFVFLQTKLNQRKSISQTFLIQLLLLLLCYKLGTFCVVVHS